MLVAGRTAAVFARPYTIPQLPLPSWVIARSVCGPLRSLAARALPKQLCFSQACMEAQPPPGSDMLKERRISLDGGPRGLRPGPVTLEILRQYSLTGYDEMFSGGPSLQPDHVRPAYQTLLSRVRSTGIEEMRRRHKLADLTMRNQGITFTVYGRSQGLE